jgi:putative aldouronate transport system substrate-binding protein
MNKRVLALLLCFMLIASMLTGCSVITDSTAFRNMKSRKNTSDASEDSKSGEEKYPEFITVDVLDGLANYQGIQSGWFAKIIKDKFNMELNIIAPNVTGAGDILYMTRSAAGDIGDLIIYGADGGKLQDMVTAGLLTDMTDLIKDKESLGKYQKAIDALNSVIEDEGIYGIPSSVSEQSATTPSEGFDPTFGPYLRWDVYKAVGYPKMNTLEDLLPVLKMMCEACPLSSSGKKTYGISLFKDWDGNLMCLAKQPTCFYGYDELGFVLARADGSDYQSIIEEDSMYIRALKLYYEANRLGILDPESTTQDSNTLYAKYADGQILYCPWPWFCQPAYNTPDNMEAGKGFKIADIADMKDLSMGCTPYGTRLMIAIGSKAKDKERLADFIDWLYSPEGIQCSTSQSTATCGPEGLTWEMKEGEPVLTDFGYQAFYNGGLVSLPEEWGGGTWKDGVSALNFTTVLTSDTNPDTGYPYNYTLWSSVIEKNYSLLDKDWQTWMGANTTIDYLSKNDKLMVAPGCFYIAPVETSDIAALRSQCKAVIIEYSWKMIFADNDNEFNSLLKDMQETVRGLGYEQVIKVDLENAKAQNDARILAAEER